MLNYGGRGAVKKKSFLPELDKGSTVIKKDTGSFVLSFIK